MEKKILAKVGQKEITNLDVQSAIQGLDPYQAQQFQTEEGQKYVLDDLINKDTYKSDYENLNKQLTSLKSQNSIAVKKDFTKLKEYINTDICKIYSELNIEQKRTVWINVIDKIYIENGEIKEVIFL